MPGNPPTRSNRERDRRFLLALVLIATALVGFLLFPFAGSFFAAAVMASALIGLQDRTARRLGGRQYWASALLTLAVVASVVIPLGVLGVFLVNEGDKAVAWFNRTVREKGIDGVVEPLPDPLEGPAKHLLVSLPDGIVNGGVLRDIDDVKSDLTAPPPPAKFPEPEQDGAAAKGASGLGGAASATLAAFGRIGSSLARVGIFILALFFLLAEGKRLVDYLAAIVPMEKARTLALLSSFRRVSIGVLLSVAVTAAAQTLTATIAFVIARVPALPLVIFATFVCALIPVVGGASVTVAAGVLVWLSGRPGMGIFLIVWGLVAVSTIDNVVKPIVAKRDVKMRGSVVLLAMLAGVAAFGPLGLIAGPMIVAFFDAVMRMRREDGRVRVSGGRETAKSVPD
jgi:predicted PurR-regulated permease PerM